MVQRYFGKFTTINYANVECVDITRRVKLNDATRAVTTLFSPYTVPPTARSDHIADAYYDDPTYDWLIYLTNEIVDPYYGWYLDDYKFNYFIEEKYGSIENAQERIKFYRINWDGVAEQRIPASYYSNHLPYALRKYYQPELGARKTVMFYQRKREDWVTNTNKIMNIAANGEFTNSEIIDIKYNGEVVGTGECIVANATNILIQHVSGNTTANSTHIVQIIGETSNSQANSTSIELVEQIIPADEIVYWSAVTMYEYETERNEARKHITLLDANRALDAAEELRVKMKQT
jgi:hypothetical protein